MDKNWYEMGALNRGNFRSLLNRLQFLYEGVTWTEDKSWLSSIFYVKASREVLEDLNRTLENWKREQNET